MLNVLELKNQNNLNLPLELRMLVSENAMYKHYIICNKNIISGRCVVLADFDQLDLTPILKTNSLDHFVTIKEQVYPNLV